MGRAANDRFWIQYHTRIKHPWNTIRDALYNPSSTFTRFVIVFRQLNLLKRGLSVCAADTGRETSCVSKSPCCSLSSSREESMKWRFEMWNGSSVLTAANKWLLVATARGVGLAPGWHHYVCCLVPALECVTGRQNVSFRTTKSMEWVLVDFYYVFSFSWLGTSASCLQYKYRYMICILKAEFSFTILSLLIHTISDYH